MFLGRIRRIGRVFAIVLLAWTAIDLLDYGVCRNHGVLPDIASPDALACLTGAGEDSAGHHHRDGPLAGHLGDCFCCSSFVDVKTPFHLSVASSAVWLVPPPDSVYLSVARPHFDPPPIAA